MNLHPDFPTLSHPTAKAALPRTLPAQGNLVVTKSKGLMRLVLFIALHIPLGLLLYNSSLLAVLHPLLTFIFGLKLALNKKERLSRIAFVCVYIMGSEVLWRMAKSPIFWEFGKYSIAAIMIAALVRRSYWRIPMLPKIYLFLLLPATFVTLSLDSFSGAKDKISFNLSGPFLILISCWFFSYLQINTILLKKILLYITVPLLSIAVATLYYTVSNADIQFNNESNSATSGGYGPNQVSSMLGLGVFICLSIYLLFKNNVKETLFFGTLAVFLAAQSVLTFSRGGIYNAIGSAIFVIIFQLRSFNEGTKRVFKVAGIVLFFLILVFPYLDNFTGGTLQARFEDTDSTGRTEIIEADYQIFLDNPILGAGVGAAHDLRKEYFGKEVGSHTEFARVISEHGMLGIISLVFLGATVIFNISRHKSTVGKALTIGLVVWSCLFMLNAGMRVAAPSVLWGMSYLTIVSLRLRKKSVLPLIKKSKHGLKFV